MNSAWNTRSDVFQLHGGRFSPVSILPSHSTSIPRDPHVDRNISERYTRFFQSRGSRNGSVTTSEGWGRFSANGSDFSSSHSLSTLDTMLSIPLPTPPTPTHSPNPFSDTVRAAGEASAGVVGVCVCVCGYMFRRIAGGDTATAKSAANSDASVRQTTSPRVSSSAASGRKDAEAQKSRSQHAKVCAIFETATQAGNRGQLVRRKQQTLQSTENRSRMRHCPCFLIYHRIAQWIHESKRQLTIWGHRRISWERRQFVV
ncbi:hypothetical protein BLNAU_3148 [Blattamonas nauphoetae]|uniref:Uncharacterized protein n=1 Tax=Blattamonas nauphoetae TaxID=2049346 RepID=A0ABQ9YD75_9EUKA|nr:hypothetical protein BLNAU_3148 [Blattamonas nauphoetae]